MISILAIFESFWNITIIICLIIVIVIYFIEIQEMKVDEDSPHQKYSNNNIVKLQQSNDKFFNSLRYLGFDGIEKSLLMIHRNFKKMLVAKYNLKIDISADIVYNNKLFLNYISNPELKEFMLEPKRWFGPYYKLVSDFQKSSEIRDLQISEKIFPIFLNLENKILSEIDRTIRFEKIAIDPRYEEFLKFNASKSKRMIFYLSIVVNLIIIVIFPFKQR